MNKVYAGYLATISMFLVGMLMVMVATMLHLLSWRDGEWWILHCAGVLLSLVVVGLIGAMLLAAHDIWEEKP